MHRLVRPNSEGLLNRFKIGCQQVTQESWSSELEEERQQRLCTGQHEQPSQATHTTTARKQQNEKISERFKQENHYDDDHYEETPSGKQCHPSAIRQEETHKALILRTDRRRKEEAAHCVESKVQNQKPTGPRITSCLLFRLSRNLGLDKPEPRLEKNLDPCLHSLTETQQVETGNSSCQVSGQTSPPHTSIKKASDSTLSERIPFPAKKKEEVISVVCNEPEITRDLSITHSFSNGEFGSHEFNGLYIFPCGPQPASDTRSVVLEEDIKDHTGLEKHTDLVELSNPTRAMLSSTVVSVLAPHWNGRLRRTKRPEVTGNFEAQASLQDVTNTAANRGHERFQETIDRSLTDGSQAQFRMPFLGTRRNTVGWSTKSGPASLDYESKRKIIQAVSLDVDSGRMDNKEMYAGAVRPVPTAVSPLSLERNEQRRNPHTGHQGGLSSLSSKPTTSRMLLSLRRCHSNGRNTNAASPIPEINPLPVSSSPCDQDGQLFTTHLSQTFLNNNRQERSKPPRSPSSISCRTTETGPIISPSSSNQTERNTFETRFFSASPTGKDTEDTPFSQQAQTMTRTQPSLSCFKHTFPIREPTERQENCKCSDQSTNVFLEGSASSPRHFPYERSSLLNIHSLPRKSTLTGTSWWKQVTQEGTSTLTLNDTRNIKEKSNTPLVPPWNDNRDLASPSPTDNRRFSSQIPNNRDNNNTTESVCKGNMNLLVKKQGGTDNVKQRIAEDSPDHGSDRLVKQQYGFNLNNREPQKPYSLPDVFSSSKISRATEQTMLSHPPKDLSRHDVNTSSFTANVTELPPTLPNPKSSNTPTESSSKYNNNHCTSKTNSTPASSHNKDSQKFPKPPLSLATTNTLNSHSLTSKTISGRPLTPNTKTTSSIHSHPVASQTDICASPYIGHATPLGFERSFASVHKPFHPKTVSSLSPTVNVFSKTNYSPVSTASTSYSFATGSHPVAITAPSTSLLTPAVTPAIASSPTTITSLLAPPTTPNIISSNDSVTSSLKEGRTFSNSPESDPNKLHRVEGKRVRRVTWEDSVDLKHSEPVTVEKAEPFQVPTSSSSPQSCKVPSIFSFHKSSSPTTNASHLCSPCPKTTSIQVVKGGKYRSLSSDSADLLSRDQERSKQRPTDTMILDQGRRDVTTPRQERTLSVESGSLQCRSSAPLSLPADFSSGYKLRYSSPPYSTLMSTRSTQGETKTILPRSPLFQQSQSNYTPHLSMCTDSVAAMTLPTSKPPLSPISLPQSLPLPFQVKTTTHGRAKGGVSETDQVNNNHSKSNSQDYQNGQILLIDNRLHEAHSSSSTCVTETLVYSVKSKVDTATTAPMKTTPKPLQHTENTQASMETTLSQQSHRMQSKEAAREPHSHSDQSSSGSSSSSNGRVKENALGKSRFFPVESNNEQSPKRSRFALKKSVSTPNSSLSISQSEKASKTKIDQVFNRLRQTFSTRRSDDDMLFPWKWKRASQTPPVSGSSDVTDITVENTQKLVQQEQDEGMLLKDNEKGTDATNRWTTKNRYTVIPPSVAGSTMAGDELYIWSDKSTPETNREEQTACAEHMESQNQPRLTITSPTTHQLDFYKDNGTDYKAINQFLYCRDPSPCRSPNPSADYPTQFRKSTSSPRSPFSPFFSLSPVSPVSQFSSMDVTDDSVFYSPKLQRHRESPSPCEPGEGIRLGRSRRSRASTGPPSAGPGQDKERLASSYADLKYGIEPGRSFSVSSVLSSRPSGPGRISTGSRFMSVGDLSDSALTCGDTGKDLDQWSITPDWTTEYDCQPSKDCRLSYFTSDPGKMRSKSLPRSLTRRLANWSSEDFPSPPVTTTTSKSAHLWSPNMNTCQIAWDKEAPQTPPPTSPLSPVSRRMSKPPSLSSPTSPSSSGASQQVDNLSPRGLLPSKGYVSSLSTFDESSDSSSDTTTDDEYYLETGEGKEKETEL
ncbi:mucin-17 [Anarrhichthys ocellatus]|uniref:mucin-17 n=1 Tax=Anarrhichthys ocellatus TaxID=433405 RepID=UPI0012EE0956|nr:mucin-17-like [Anarrhichthys ocellatus]